VLDDSKLEPVETAVILNSSHKGRIQKPKPKTIEFVEKEEQEEHIEKPQKTSLVTSVLGIKLISALSYLCFFLPLIFCRHEPYAIFHANQSLILWLIVSVLYVIFWLVSINVLVLLAVMIFHILGVFFGVYNALHNRARSFFGTNKLYVFRP
jgi:uncharacterized membrane protein